METGGPTGEGGAEDGTVDDAGTDGATTKFCGSQSPAPTFCRDFDQGAVNDGWTGSQLEPATNVIALDPLYHSAPSSFLSRAQTATGDTFAVLEKELPGSVLDTSFWVRLGTPEQTSGASDTFYAWIVATGSGGSECVTLLTTESEGLGRGLARFQGNGKEVNLTLDTFPQVGHWTRMGVHWDASANTTMVSVSLMREDESTATTVLQPTAHQGTCGNAVKFTLVLGMAYASNEARYDDVIATAQ